MGPRGRIVQEVFRKWKILRGDRVRIISGKEKGQQGTVLRVFRDKNRVLIEGRNLVTKHMKGQEGRPGQKVTVESPVHVSNVRLLNPVTGERFPFAGKATREPSNQWEPCSVAWKATREPIEGKFDADGNQEFKTVKERVVASGDPNSEDILVPRPEKLAERKKPKPTTAGPKDTPKEAVRKQTFDPSTGVGGLPPLDELLDRMNIRPYLREGTVRHLVRAEQRREEGRRRQTMRR